MNSFTAWMKSASRTNKRLFLAMALLCLCTIAAAVYIAAYTDLRYQWQSRNSIVELRELPLGRAKIRGVVTYVDDVNKRFWLQDETGAVAIDDDPAQAGVHFADLVFVEMNKTHPYDPNVGSSSLGLTGFKVATSLRNATLPSPTPATIPALSEEAKSGIRVTVEGVIQHVAEDNGRVQLQVGDAGQKVQAVVAGDSRRFAAWLNARVRLTGVLQVLLDEAGIPDSNIMWVQNTADVEKLSDPPTHIAASSIRSLYADIRHITPNQVRLRGRVLDQERPDSLLVEDQGGAVLCTLSRPGKFAPKSPVEVLGFLKRDGLRLDLVHAVATSIPPEGARDFSPDAPPKSIAAVRALSEEAVRSALPVKVTGVITYLDADFRQLFLQDSTAGIFMKYPGTPNKLYQGERVTVVGLVNEGDFAPVIVAPKFLPIGPAPMPTPALMTMRAESGVFDSLYAQIDGVVHPIQDKQFPKHTSFDLYTSLGPVHVGVTQDESNRKFITRLEDATVRLRGVVAEVFNSRKQIIGLQLSISNMRDIEVLEPGGFDPFVKSPMPISRLLKYSPQSRFDHRVVVRGTVTLLGNGFFYIQDESGGVRIESHTSDLHLHDVVDAAGYAVATGYSPVLTDAVVKVRQKGSAIASKRVSAEMVGDGTLDSQMVTIEGTLLSIENSAGRRTLALTSDGRTFQTVLYLIDTGQPFIPPQVGSLLRVTGICSVDVSSSKMYKLLRKDPVAFKLIAGSPADIQVLRNGSWWTLRRTLVVVSILVLGVLFSGGRIAVLLRRIKDQNEELRKASEKADAVRQLVDAMQEVRVKKDFTSRVSVSASDELALLGSEFNHMIEELHVRDMAMADAESKLQHQALSDALTGLPNRRLLSDRLSQSIATAKRDGSIVAVLYIDLDGFKLVNDSFGHNFGDVLLVRVTERIASRIRKSDTLSRLGGDEFAVVLNRLKTVNDAELVAQTLLQVLATPFDIDGQEITIGASIGICLFPEHAENESELLQHADSAMYAAKRTGKNRAVLFTKDLGESVRERLTIENQLRRAIEDGNIEVHYQPEFEIASGRLVRFEALARWTHPTLGTIPPSKFIPIAEESGLIIPLGAYIMERACADCLSWQSTSRTPVEVAVNVSSVQFCRESFVQEVQAILGKSGLSPKLLQIELTESVMLSGLESAAATIRHLQSLGVTVAIDDFGTGYSALSYIPKLPINALKIDRVFMKEFMQRSETKAMVRSLVLLAHELGMKVIVEGIETEAQLKAIEEMGGNEVQGYLLGRPTSNPLSHLLQPEEMMPSAASLQPLLLENLEIH